MAAPTLVIGIGGTGIRVLLRVKERLLEAYDEVPEDVILYELDTDDYTDTRDTFNGVGLLCTGDKVGDRYIPTDESEFYWVATENATETLDTVFDRKKSRKPEWQWINEGLLRRTLAKPGDRVIKAGARTVRPVGRSALFLDYSKVYKNLKARLEQVAGRQQSINQGLGDTNFSENGKLLDDKKATVFVVGSVAGGSGAGMFIDILRMIEHMRNDGELKDAPIAVITLLVGGSSFTDRRGERVDSNTFAALRELDRLGAVAGRPLSAAVPPVMWAPKPVGRFISDLGPADMILLFDKPDRLGRDRNVRKDIPNAYLEWVIAPTLSDIVMTFADEKIVPAMRTVRADMAEKWQRTDPITDEIGFFPYASAGIHTLIFPERDVRRSAGLRLLLEIWDRYLVQPHPPTEQDLPPITTELWADDTRPSSNLTPEVFVDAAFLRSNICKGAANNNFIQMIVTSAINEQIKLPSAKKFLWIFGGRSMIRRVIALIGLPNVGHANLRLERVADQQERQIDKSIERIDRLRNINEVKDWRRKYLGEGGLGNEEGGEWIRWLEEAENIRGHRRDFQNVLQQVVIAILNDQDSQERHLPYRMEYAKRVLERLEQHILRLTQGDPRDPNRGALLSEFFQQEINNESNARERVRELEPPASRGENFSAYLNANRQYARCKKELIGKHLLELLCEDLLVEVTNLQVKLQDWQNYMLKIRDMLAEEQTRHERNRIQKSRIPVRTYVTDRPKGKHFKDGEFEKGLYDKHSQQAINSFLTSTEWIWSEEQFELKAPFGKNPIANLSAEEALSRAITWACTRRGNPDRPGAPPPLRDLASPQEVKMAVRIRDYFGPSGAQSLVTQLTSDPYLASLCPLTHDWPRTRLMYTLGLPRTAPAEDDVEKFYNQAERQINQETAPPRFDQRRLMIFDPENPRHAVAAEFAVGFKLQHRSDQEHYIKAYREDTNQFFALHCLPEEDRASTYYEMEFKRDSELYRPLSLSPLLLDPTVVDLLGDPKRLELFVKAIAVKVIGLLPRDIRKDQGADFYLWPQDKTQRIRLSKMNTPEEIDKIVRELAKTADQVNNLRHNTKLVNRLRLLYALRTFVLLEHSAEEEYYKIDYEQVQEDVDRTIKDYSLEERLQNYREWRKKFLSYYTEHNPKHIVLAHLGLVLARIVDDLWHHERERG
jgi:hypothetical protein